MDPTHDLGRLLDAESRAAHLLILGISIHQKPVILRASDKDARRTSITHPPQTQTHAIPRPPPKPQQLSPLSDSHRQSFLHSPHGPTRDLGHLLLIPGISIHQKPVILRASDEDARRTSITHPPQTQTHAIPRPPPKTPTTLATL